MVRVCSNDFKLLDTAILIFLILFHAVSVSGQHLRSHVHHSGYHCTEEEIAYQFEYIDLVWPSICDSPTIWRLAQLAIPDANVFIDVGGNRGYTAAKIFGLWTPGHNLNRRSLKRSILEDSEKYTYINKNNLDTVCGDGGTEDLAVFCIGGSQLYNFACQHRRSIKVFSFDGQFLHINNTRDTIYRHFPELHPNTSEYTGLKSSWEYIHAAMVGPSFENYTYGYFSSVTDESGALRKWKQGDIIPEKSSIVPLLTVDQFVKNRGIKTVDVLKVDAEGMDDEVIKGAYKTLHYHHVKMIEFECFECGVDRWQKLFKVLDLNYGFDCYLAGPFNLLVRITNCWNNSLAYDIKRPLCAQKAEAGYFNCTEERVADQRLAGNGYCAHRYRASALAKMFDDMSLYRYSSYRRGDIFTDALISVGTEFKDNKRLGVEFYSAEGLKRRSGRDHKKNFTKTWW